MIMYVIKQIPEDFRVKELFNLKIDKIGAYGIFILKKKSYTTLDAISKISEKIRIDLKDIGYAGNKDKHAVSEQYISIKNPNLSFIENLNLKDIELNFIGKSKDPISLGDLEGNEFEITVRNLVDEDIDNIDKKAKKIEFIPNYFDEQRFSKDNVKIGKLLLKRKFKEAIILIDDAKMNDYVKKNKNNFIGALRLLPKKRLMIYIHSVQSYIFNETLRLLIKKGRKMEYSLGKFIFPEKEIKNEKIPIAGFGIQNNDDNLGKIINKLLKKIKINDRDFIFREISYLSSEGSSRDSLISTKGFTISEIGKDTINKEKYFARLKFSLGKGCYATMVVRYLFG